MSTIFDGIQMLTRSKKRQLERAITKPYRVSIARLTKIDSIFLLKSARIISRRHTGTAQDVDNDQNDESEAPIEEKPKSILKKVKNLPFGAKGRKRRLSMHAKLFSNANIDEMVQVPLIEFGPDDASTSNIPMNAKNNNENTRFFDGSQNSTISSAVLKDLADVFSPSDNNSANKPKSDAMQSVLPTNATQHQTNIPKLIPLKLVKSNQNENVLRKLVTVNRMVNAHPSTSVHSDKLMRTLNYVTNVVPPSNVTNNQHIPKLISVKIIKANPNGNALPKLIPIHMMPSTSASIDHAVSAQQVVQSVRPINEKSDDEV